MSLWIWQCKGDGDGSGTIKILSDVYFQIDLLIYKLPFVKLQGQWQSFQQCRQKCTLLERKLNNKGYSHTKATAKAMDSLQLRIWPIVLWVSELEKADNIIIQQRQNKHYADEKRVLQTKENGLSKTISLYKLSLFRNVDGIIKAWILRQAYLSEVSRRPVILPGKPIRIADLALTLKDLPSRSLYNFRWNMISRLLECRRIVNGCQAHLKLYDLQESKK